MLVQYRDLDEGCVILLFNRHKHAHDVTKQVCPALWDTVKEDRLLQWELFKLLVQLVQVITFCDNSRH